MDWGTRRKARIIGILGMVVLIIAGLLVYKYFFSKPETCSDGIQNQNERGIDCGGACVRFCPADTRALVPAWARFLPVGQGYGTVVAVIENQNRTALAKNVAYEIRLYDERNILVTDPIRGSVSVEPNGRSSVVVPNIAVGERTVTHVYVSFPVAFEWLSVGTAQPRDTLGTDTVVIERDPFLRISARLQNRGSKALSGVRVVAIASNADGNAVAAAETTVDSVPAFGSSQLFFTWPPSVRTELTRVDFIIQVPDSLYAQVPTER
jgi:hypothetical protein